MRRVRVFPFVLGVLLLAGGAGAGVVGEGKVEILENRNRVAGVKKVFLSDFAVAYRVSVTKDQGSGRGLFGAGGDRGDGAVSMVANYKLGGVSDAEFQDLTDRLHAMTVERLRAAGFEVVGKDELEPDPAWKKVVAGGVASGGEQDGYRIFAPTGMTVHNPRAMSTGNAISQGLGGASHDGPMSNVGRLAHQHGAAAVEFAIQVDFAKLTGKGEVYGYTTTASVKADYATTIKQDKQFSTRIIPPAVIKEYNNPFGGGKAYETDPVKGAAVAVTELMLQPGAFITETRDATGAGLKAAEIGANVLGALMGGRKSTSVAVSEAVADPAAYQANVLELGRRYLDGMIAELKSAAR